MGLIKFSFPVYLSILYEHNMVTFYNWSPFYLDVLWWIRKISLNQSHHFHHKYPSFFLGQLLKYYFLDSFLFYFSFFSSFSFCHLLDWKNNLLWGFTLWFSLLLKARFHWAISNQGYRINPQNIPNRRYFHWGMRSKIGNNFLNLVIFILLSLN